MSQPPEIVNDINPQQYIQDPTSDPTPPPSVPPPLTLFTSTEDSSSPPSDVTSQQHQTNSEVAEPFYSKPIRLFLDLFAGHSAPLSCAAKAMNIDHFSPFDIEFNATCDILNDDLFENLLKLAHSGLIGAVWSAPPCRFYSTLRKNDGGPPPLRSKEFLDGFSFAVQLPKTSSPRIQGDTSSIRPHLHCCISTRRLCRKGTTS